MILRWVVGVALAAVPFAFAKAADLPVLKAAPLPPSWSGAYAGATVGARWTAGDFTSSNVMPAIPGSPTLPANASAGSTAARFGGYVGYNYQFAPQWVAGIEGYGGYANNGKTLSPVPGAPFLIGGAAQTNSPVAVIRETWDAGIRARLGYLVTPSTLVYATGGGAWQSLSIRSYCPSFGFGSDVCTINEGTPKVSKTMSGWTAGAGVEYRLTANWLVRFEYQYADFGSFSNTFFSVAPGAVFDDRYTASLKLKTHTASLGIAYKF